MKPSTANTWWNAQTQLAETAAAARLAPVSASKADRTPAALWPLHPGSPARSASQRGLAAWVARPAAQFAIFMSGAAQDAPSRPGTSPGSLLAAGGALLDGLLGSPRGRPAAAAAAAADEEQPLLAASPGQAAVLRSPAHDERRPWPQLRGSSVSTRPFTPGLLAQELASHDESWELDQDSASSPRPADGSPSGHTAARSGSGGSAPDAAATAAATCGKQGGGSGTAVAGHTHAYGHPRRRWRHTRAMFAGLVDCTIALPLQTSFAAIIFRVRAAVALVGRQRYGSMCTECNRT